MNGGAYFMINIEGPMMQKNTEQELDKKGLHRLPPQGHWKIAEEAVCVDVGLIRRQTQLSQAAFALLLGVSVRTLQEWEQGRRHPSGAAYTLLKVAAQFPAVLPCLK
jgi:DNA-binding transcriptional regulator YiaG